MLWPYSNLQTNVFAIFESPTKIHLKRNLSFNGLYWRAAWFHTKRPNRITTHQKWLIVKWLNMFFLYKSNSDSLSAYYSPHSLLPCMNNQKQEIHRARAQTQENRQVIGWSFFYWRTTHFSVNKTYTWCAVRVTANASAAWIEGVGSSNWRYSNYSYFGGV